MDLKDIKHIFDSIDKIEFSYNYRNRPNRRPQGSLRVDSVTFSSFLEKNDYFIKSLKINEN